MDDKKTNDFGKLAAVLLFAACVGALLYMFSTGLDSDHKTMVTMLGMGALFAAFEVL
jgi:hypothetical protein